MTERDFLKTPVEDIYSSTATSASADVHPQTRAADIMMRDGQSEYPCTADPSRGARDSLVIDTVQEQHGGYFAGNNCIGCKLCYSVCPQKCIDISAKPVVINQNSCLRCGRCAEICPKQTIQKVV